MDGWMHGWMGGWRQGKEGTWTHHATEIEDATGSTSHGLRERREKKRKGKDRRQANKTPGRGETSTMATSAKTTCTITAHQQSFTSVYSWTNKK